MASRRGHIPPDLTPPALFEKKPGELALLAASFRPLMPLFSRYLLVGGFPETARQESVVSACFVTQREEDFGVQQIKGIATRFLRVPAHVLSFLLGQAERLQWQAAKGP